MSNIAYKPDKVGQTGLILGLWSEFISSSVQARSQDSKCCGLCHPG